MLDWLIFAISGLFSGILAGFLGIGGGTILVPLLTTLGYSAVQAAATSSLAIVITATSGTIQNVRMGYVRLNNILYIGIPALFAAQLGVYLAELAESFEPAILLFAFGLLLLLNIYLVELRKRVVAKQQEREKKKNIFARIAAGETVEVFQDVFQGWRKTHPKSRRLAAFALPALMIAQVTAYWSERFAPSVFLSACGLLLLTNLYVELRNRIGKRNKQAEPNHRDLYRTTLARLATGGTAGVLAGLFGVGGGVIMVPLQILLLGESIKSAIQTSLGVIVITAISACAGHALNGNVLWLQGFLLGVGGLVGAQISTRFLPKLPTQVITNSFRILLIILAIYSFYQGWSALSQPDVSINSAFYGLFRRSTPLIL